MIACLGVKVGQAGRNSKVTALTRWFHCMRNQREIFVAETRGWKNSRVATSGRRQTWRGCRPRERTWSPRWSHPRRLRGQTVGRTGNGGERRNDGGEGGGREKICFLSLSFFPGPLPSVVVDPPTPVSPPENGPDHQGEVILGDPGTDRGADGKLGREENRRRRGRGRGERAVFPSSPFPPPPSVVVCPPASGSAPGSPRMRWRCFCVNIPSSVEMIILKPVSELTGTMSWCGFSCR